MTAARIREVHGLRQRKGVDEELYRLRLAAVGAASCKDFSQTQFVEFMRRLRLLPDSPAWLARQARRGSAQSRRRARG